MQLPIDLFLFTIGPIAVMTVGIAYTIRGIHYLSDYRPFLLVALLGLMVLHQLTELVEFAGLGFLQFQSRPAEAFESGANVLASVASYSVIKHLEELRTAEIELEASNAAVRERSTMVSVLYRILRHNVRNDVNIIAGQAENAAARVDDETVLAQIESIQRRAWSLETISDRTQRIKQIVSDEPNVTETIQLPEALRAPIETVLAGAPSATINLVGPEVPALAARAPATFTLAVADVLEQIIAHNDGDVAIEVRVSGDSSQSGDGRPIRIEICDDGEGLPVLDTRTIEHGEETPLLHAEGLALWCLSWTVERVDGTLEIGSGEGTVNVYLPQASNGVAG